MAYEVVMPYHLHMPSYFLETFTEYPCIIPCIRPRFLYLETDRLFALFHTHGNPLFQSAKLGKTAHTTQAGISRISLFL